MKMKMKMKMKKKIERIKNFDVANFHKELEEGTLRPLSFLFPLSSFVFRLGLRLDSASPGLSHTPAYLS